MPEKLKSLIRDIPDFPKPGVLFKDITPLLADGDAFARTLELLARRYKGKGITQVVAMEARGFILGAPLALRLGAGFVPVRKKGKLPYATIEETYALEYGEDTLQMHKDALVKGSRVLIVDDVLATGGTAAAVVRLVKKMDAELIECAFLMEIGFLKGRDKLEPVPTFALIQY